MTNERSVRIWKDFTDRGLKIEPAKSVLDLHVHLFVKVVDLSETFQQDGYRMTMQLFRNPKNPQCLTTEIQGLNDSRLFTEIPFAKHILAEDLVMLLKVYKVHLIPQN